MRIQQLARINIMITIAIFIGNVFYQGLGFNYPLKIVCSSGFALMGIINMAYAYKIIENKKVLIFMTLGLVFAFLGDVAINPNFILGVILFALGHVFFVVSYLAYKNMDKLDMIFSAALGAFSITFILVFPYLVFEVSALKYVVLVYAAIISVMVGKAVGNAIRNKSIFTGMIMAGSILFFISDMMLLLAWFSSIEGRWTSNVCMAAYYPGLCLLAGSMVAYIKKHEKG
ncbi:MAG: lysoplasmalogenase [Agathobacter sp.]|nr:lysoplasmalogenase [Agathobacter sp.]